MPICAYHVHTKAKNRMEKLWFCTEDIIPFIRQKQIQTLIYLWWHPATYYMQQVDRPLVIVRFFIGWITKPFAHIFEVAVRTQRCFNMVNIGKCYKTSTFCCLDVPKKLITTRKICLVVIDLLIMLPPQSIVRNTRMVDIKYPLRQSCVYTEVLWRAQTCIWN